MSTPAEDALFVALTDVESLEVLSKIGLVPDAIPTEQMRPVVAWALDCFFKSGRKQAPSRELLIDTWAEAMEEAEVVLLPEGEEFDTIESAVASLQDHHIKLRWQKFLQEHGPGVVSASPLDRKDALSGAAAALFDLVEAVSDHSQETDSTEGFATTLADYKQRVAEGTQARGMTFGLAPIDEHTYGIHPGELAVLAAGPKVGKSFALIMVAINEFIQGRRVVLFTLENTVEMTWQRLVCLYFGVSARAFQRGEVIEEKVAEIERLIAEGFGDNLMVIQPDPGQRSVTSLVRKARTLGAESLIIDQLSHIEMADAQRLAQHEIVYQIVHGLKRQISTGRDKMSCLLAHQINRDGVKRAEKENGRYDLATLAGSSGVERAADWVFGLHQSDFQRAQQRMTWQTMAARREEIKHWELIWDVNSGARRVAREMTFES